MHWAFLPLLTESNAIFSHICYFTSSPLPSHLSRFARGDGEARSALVMCTESSSTILGERKVLVQQNTPQARPCSLYHLISPATVVLIPTRPPSCRRRKRRNWRKKTAEQRQNSRLWCFGRRWVSAVPAGGTRRFLSVDARASAWLPLAARAPTSEPRRRRWS